MNDLPDSFTFLAAQLADCDNHWSLGTFGALAEFTRDRQEPVVIADDGSAACVVTDRGGIRIAPVPGMRLFASESATRAGWNHRIALCLREDACAMGGRGVLTELGRDREALRDRDRDAILFDLGLDAVQVDACVRIADPAVVAALRPHVGRAVFEAGNPAMGIVVPASPHRVFVSRLGRIEVFQPIPPPDGRSPEGPHTHVLPKLLQHKRSHAATEPVPQDFVPCAHLYPAHPAKDALGRELPFDARRHDCFQRMLLRFGDPEALAMKRRVIAAVEQGGDPSALDVPDQRFARASIRVTLRQMQASHDTSPALAAWLHAYDRAHGGASELDDAEAMHGHQ
jgi:hypothetical protein